MTGAFTESVVEQAALAWLETVGWWVRSGAVIAPGELYGHVVLAQRLRDALLPKPLSGELRVKDAERFIGRTV